MRCQFLMIQISYLQISILQRFGIHLMLIFSIFLYSALTYYNSLTMPVKQKIVLSHNHNKYQFSHLLRHYQLATKHSPQYLTSSQTFQILQSIGFLPEQPCAPDYELVNTITFMLAYPQGQRVVSQRNLFRFLMALTETTGKIDGIFGQEVRPLPRDIHGIEEQPLVTISLGAFDQEGKWNLSHDEEKQLRQIFKKMVYTRASRKDLQILRKEPEQTSHKPSILIKSKAMAMQKFKRSGLYMRVEDRLLQAKRMTQSRLQSELHQSAQKEVKQCTFKPTINSFTFSVQKQNMSSFNRTEHLLLKGRQYEVKKQLRKIQKQQYVQRLNESMCSFEPNLNESRRSLQSSMRRSRVASVKNEDIAVSRLRMGRQERQHLNQTKNRGYPANVSWLKYLEQTRNSATNTSSVSFIEEASEITLNFQSQGGSLSLAVKVGDTIEQIVRTLCQKCNMPNHMKGNVLNIVKSSINNSDEAYIRNGRICLKQ